MSIYINKDTRVITQGITGKTGQFHTLGCQAYANGKNCFVAGVNPKKAGEKFSDIPIYASVLEAKQQEGANVSVIYVPPAGAAADGAQQDEGQGSCWRQEDFAARPQLPGPDHA
jgi:succinyl-CoA synthetase alpha subunit